MRNAFMLLLPLKIGPGGQFKKFTVPFSAESYWYTTTTKIKSYSLLIIQAQHQHTGKLLQVKLQSWQLWCQWGCRALIFEAHRLHPRNSLAQFNFAKKTQKQKEVKSYFELQDSTCPITVLSCFVCILM